MSLHPGAPADRSVTPAYDDGDDEIILHLPGTRRPSSRTDMTDEEKTVADARRMAQAPARIADPHLDEDGNIIESRQGWTAVLGCVLIALPCMGWARMRERLAAASEADDAIGPPQVGDGARRAAGLLCEHSVPQDARGDHLLYQRADSVCAWRRTDTRAPG